MYTLSEDVQVVETVDNQVEIEQLNTGTSVSVVEVESTKHAPEVWARLAKPRGSMSLSW